MAFFRNLTLFRFPAGLIGAGDELADALQGRPLRPIGPMESFTAGFVPPFGEAIVHADGDAVLFCLATTEKILPPAVIRDELARRVKEIREREDRSVGARERKRLREEIVDEFLPRAFTRTRRIRAYVDTERGWMVVDTASRKDAESLLHQLREALGSFPVTPPTPAERPSEVLTAWLRTCDPASDGDICHDWDLGYGCELRERCEDGAIVRARRQDLGSAAILKHLQDGLEVTALDLAFNGRMHFEAEPAAIFALQHRELAHLLASLTAVFDIPREAALHLDGGAAAPEVREGLRERQAAVHGRAMREALAGLAPRPGSGIDSVTISSPGGQSVTLTAEDGARLRGRRP